MVGLKEIQSELSTLKRLGPGLVGVFVGGTSGIGEGTARAFVQNAVSPRVYLVGRSQEQADRIKLDFEKLNPESQTKFIKGDVSLIRGVDNICDEIKAQEDKINLLFMSAGFLSTQGRNGTQI
jgi:NADP-dependent 3-hydroxy acid dehydrogenase YdfG